MIQNPDVASQISSLMLEISERVNESMRLVQAECSDEEFKKYRLASGYILGYAYTDVLVPLYEEHPDLKPEEMP
jgi:hypothetical protein